MRSACMRRHDREIGEERVAGRDRPADEGPRLLRVQTRRVLAREGPQRAVDPQVRCDVLVGVMAGRRREVVPTRRDVRALVRVVVEVLAEHPRPVLGVEPGGDRRRVVEGRESAQGRDVVEDPVVVRVAAGQDRRARRAADRVGAVAAGKCRALVGDQRADGGHRRQVGHRGVVDEDDDDARMARGLVGRVGGPRRHRCLGGGKRRSDHDGCNQDKRAFHWQTPLSGARA